MTPLVVFSHLRWDFVVQRPQHLMTRLARHFDVLYIEEPIYSDGPATFDVRDVDAHLTLVQPRTPLRDAGFSDAQGSMLQAMFEAEARTYSRWGAGVAWLWTPMAVDLLETFAPRTVVYDCMDELRGFRDAPAQLDERERALLAKADLVFTSGPSLYEAKRRAHPNVHCFASSVDAAHFAQATAPHALDHAAQASLPHPRLGFYGVIDERFDPGLIATVARLRPQWHFVMVGPILKIDPALLPLAANLHWLGAQPYAALPSLLTGWDACMLPFALNDATRFVSSTKLLEYMAAERPIVSTPIEDVARQYGDIVEIAAGALAFIAAIERVLGEDTSTRAQRIAGMRRAVGSTSWEATAACMRTLIEAAFARRQVVREAKRALFVPRTAAGGARLAATSYAVPDPRLGATGT